MERTPVRSAAARPALPALLLVAALLACKSGTQSTITPPTSVQPGVPTGSVPIASAVGASGGTLRTPDGRLTVQIPPGAVTAPTSFSIQEITNTAPRGLGKAYRLEPSGTRFQVPVAITFDIEWTSAQAGGLGVSYQDASGYWVPVLSVLRNSSAKLLTVSSTHFSDWSLVPTDPTQDMAGQFTVSSTVETPAAFTANGTVSLAYAGSNSAERLYLLSGTAALQPLTYAGAACTPDSVTHNLTPNLAQAFISPAHLSWGASAAWNLSCGGNSQLTEMVFDTSGITHIGCARGPTLGGSPEVATQDTLSGDYTIDCSSSGAGAMRIVWGFQRCGASCTSSNTCATSAVLTCSSSTPACTDTTFAAAGTSCTTATGPGVCSTSGVCVSCVQGAACTTGNPCAPNGTIDCSTGAAVCNAQPVANGTSCGTNLVCNGGTCTTCTAGVACTSSNPCAATAFTSCSTGSSVCVDQTFATAGNSCTSGTTSGVCSKSGVCTACTQGAACSTGNPCAPSGTIDCSTGSPVCNGQPVANGTSCGTSLFCTSGVCQSCTADVACTSSNPCAATAQTSCSTGIAVCTDLTLLPAGTSCTSGTVTGVCSASGVCTACTQGAPCTSSNSCATSATTDCSTGTPVCVDQTFATAGTSCTSGTVTGVCSTSGQCTACTPGAICTSTNPCATSADIVCSSGGPVCTDTAFQSDGTSCGGSNICLGDVCSVCSPGATCLPSANLCDTGSLQCADPVAGTSATCVDTGVLAVTCPTGQTCNPATGLCQ